MKLQQMRYLCEIAECGYRFSRAAHSLHTSQPGLSRQIKQLERELGVDIFVRNRGRIAEVTAPGHEIIALARSVLREVERVKMAAREFAEGDGGQLSVAATYMLARYALPPIYERFVARHPRVSLRLVQESPDRISAMAAMGEVDLAITTHHAGTAFDGVLIDYCKLPRVLLVPQKHPLLHKKPLTLRNIADHPLIRLGQHRMRGLFAENGLHPKVIFTDLQVDVDVIKALVEAGLGLAVLPAISYDPRRDTRLRAIPVGHLFEPLVCSIAMRKNRYLRSYMYDFIRLLEPRLERPAIDAALANSC
jgi:LysR family transcriptional regulator, cys regulon transcriptional activator